MSQQVNVERELRFRGAAVRGDNIKGNPSCEKMAICDDFFGAAVDTTNDYNSTLDGTSDAVAYDNTPGGGGWIKMTTGTGDNEISFLATNLDFDIDQEPEIETRLKLADVSGTVVFFGFSDATSETSPAATIDYADGTLAAAATDAVGFVVDADKGSSSIYCASIASGGSVTATDSGVDWADNETKVLRIRLNSDGDAEFLIDGVVKHIQQTAVTDVPLCAIWNWGTRDNDGANYVYADYLKSWQDRT